MTKINSFTLAHFRIFRSRSVFSKIINMTRVKTSFWYFSLVLDPICLFSIKKIRIKKKIKRAFFFLIVFFLTFLQYNSLPKISILFLTFFDMPHLIEKKMLKNTNPLQNSFFSVWRFCMVSKIWLYIAWPKKSSGNQKWQNHQTVSLKNVSHSNIHPSRSKIFLPLKMVLNCFWKTENSRFSKKIKNDIQG